MNDFYKSNKKSIQYINNDGNIDKVSDTRQIEDKFLSDNPNKKEEIRKVKRAYGQGKHNIPKDRKPGAYLQAQDLIDHNKVNINELKKKIKNK